jgi:hypothetical protein
VQHGFQHRTRSPDLAKLANALLQVAEQMRQHNEQEVDQSDEAA